MPNSPICLDASLVVRLVVDVQDDRIQEQWAQWAQQNRQLVAPALLWYEVTNALYQYQKHGILDGESVQLAQETALSLPVQILGDAGLHQRALQLTQEFALPAAYDAHYLALAERYGAEFWTSDQRLVTAVSPPLSWVCLWP